MKSQRLRALSFFFAAFSIISTIFQTVAIQEDWIRISIVVCTVIAMILAFVLYVRSNKYTHAAKDILSLLSKNTYMPKRFELRHIDNEYELRELWEISRSIYGDDIVDYRTVSSWYKCYPKGIYALFNGSEIVACISIWPLKKGPYEEIKSGKRSEHEISYQSIQKDGLIPKKYWYIASIVVVKKYRRTRLAAIKILLNKSIQECIAEGGIENEINISAFGYSKEGEALLKRFGFKQWKRADETASKLPLYVYSASSPDAFRAIVDRLKSD